LKYNTVLIVLSLLNALFFGLHLTGDIVFGIEAGEVSCGQSSPQQ